MLLLKALVSLVDFVERTYLVQWQAHDTCLLCKSL